MVYYQNSLPAPDADGKQDNPYALILLAGIVYPSLYSLALIFTYRLEYFLMPSNWVDVFYIGGSITQCLLHLEKGPFNFESKFVMIFVIMFSLIRTFKFMRIFKDFSPIVTMLTTVVYDLKAFLLFYIILNGLFSLLFGIVGICNLNESINKLFHDAFDEDADKGEAYPGVEYRFIGLFVGNIFSSLRVSVGDYARLEAANWLNDEDNMMFWIFWFLIVVVASIVFLNFIIAEASASYEKVAAELD